MGHFAEAAVVMAKMPPVAGNRTCWRAADAGITAPKAAIANNRRVVPDTMPRPRRLPPRCHPISAVPVIVTRPPIGPRLAKRLSTGYVAGQKADLHRYASLGQIYYGD